MFNTHVAFDSEYYLSIAVVGYDDPDVPQYAAPDGDGCRSTTRSCPPIRSPCGSWPPRSAGWAWSRSPRPRCRRASSCRSLATLVAMLALFSLARRHLGEGGAIRAAFYLLIFPSGFFLAQVYTEALFLALSFGALALVADRRPLLAGLLAIVAVLTRPVGIALVLPIGRARRGHPALAPGGRGRASRRLRRAGRLGRRLVAPVVAYLAWSWSGLGRTFEIVQREYFGRGLLNFEAAWEGWGRRPVGLRRGAARDAVYYGLEVAAVVLAVVACVWALRRWPAAALFGLAALSSRSPAASRRA